MKELIAELKKLGVEVTPTMRRDGERGILFNNGEREECYPIRTENVQTIIAAISLLMTKERREKLDRWQKVSKNLTYVLKRKLKGDELARPFFDMWIVPQIVLSENSEQRVCGSIRPEALENWGVDENTVFDVAFENAFQSHTIKTMRQVIAQIMGIPEEMVPDNGVSMYVCSNKNSIHGAGAMLDKNVLHKISDMTGSERLIIFPSSIHECIIVPFTENVNPDMVREINTTSVKEEDVLSDNAFVYEDGEYFLLH